MFFQVLKYGGKKTNARLYVADVDGPAIFGLPTSCTCELQLVELNYGIRTTKMPYPTNKDESDLQLLYPDRINSIGKLKREYHIDTDPETYHL